MAAGDVVVISWISYHGRSAGIAEALDGRAIFMPWARPRLSPFRRVWSWSRSAGRTVRVLRRKPPPDVVVVMTPPVFAPLVAWLARRSESRLVLDLHSGALNDSRWRWSRPLLLRLMAASDLVLATNHEILTGLDLAKVRVRTMHDVIPGWPHRTGPAPQGGERPLVLFPASGAADEPLAAVAGAAESLGADFEVVVTGRVQPAEPGSRLVWTGYLSEDDYLALLERASVVLALTTRPATMQRAAYEALAVRCPIVASDSAVLRSALGPSAVYTAPDASSIAAAVRAAHVMRDDLVAAGVDVAASMANEAAATLAEIHTLGGGGRTSPGPDGKA